MLCSDLGKRSNAVGLFLNLSFFCLRSPKQKVVDFMELLGFFTSANSVVQVNKKWIKARQENSAVCALRTKKFSSPVMCTPSSTEKISENFEDQNVTDSTTKPNSNEECPYCNGGKIVECPACEGRGYHGRTITCYYCAGAQKIECPLCTDDIYKFSYTQPNNPTIDQDSDSN